MRLWKVESSDLKLLLKKLDCTNVLFKFKLKIEKIRVIFRSSDYEATTIDHNPTIHGFYFPLTHHLILT
jgi:hypothetical protein